ncbi:MAG TPA: hypothetical protein VFV48_05685, partial [Pseudomonadales bacterium]|nr:hypothetical protein [Pseudomonadales bacterium]
DVGITYPWIRPPEELYGFANVPVSALAGFSMDYRKYFDDNWVRAQLYGGRDNFTIPALGTKFSAKVDQMYGLALSAGTENFEVRLSATDVKLTMNLRDDLMGLPAAQELQASVGNSVVSATAQLAGANAAVNGIEAQINSVGGVTAPAAAAYMPAYQAALADMAAAGAALQAAGAQAAGAAATFAAIPNGSGDAGFMGVGARYDNGTVLLMGEAGKRPVGGIPFPDTTAGFVTAGLHMGQFMPHLTYSVLDTDHSDLINQSQESYILGVRYDVQPWAALKVEYQYTKLGDATLRSAGSPFINPNDPSTKYVQSSGLFNEPLNLATLSSNVPDEVNKISVAFNMVF